MINYILAILLLMTIFFGQKNLSPTIFAGKPLIKNYLTADHKGSAINYDIRQDFDGIIYIANGKGILINDGAKWDLLHHKMQSSIRSI